MPEVLTRPSLSFWDHILFLAFLK